MRDFATPLLALAVTAGFFSVLAYMLLNGLPTNDSREALLLLLGSLSTQWALIIGYYFGTTKGESAKAKTIADALDKATPNVE